MNALDISRGDLARALDGISGARVGLIGDICLDAYWTADMKKSELSRETPHFPLPIVSERYSPGAGGNAACNMAALKPKSLRVMGVTGEDWRGGALRDALRAAGVGTDYLISDSGISTNAYIKPLRTGISDVVYEDPRLDFVNVRPLSAETEDALIANLRTACGDMDVLCVSDQMAVGCVTERVRREINRLAAEGLTVVVDSRDRIGLYENCVLKPNEVELAGAAAGGTFEDMARYLSDKNHARVLATLGEKGCLLCENGEIARFDAVKIEGPIDICGAGDTFLSAFACVLAGGADARTAVMAATLASSVTIRKIGRTGTADRGEILAARDSID